MANITYICPNCGAEIFWSAKKTCFHCIYCENEYSLEELEVHTKINEHSFQKHTDVGNDLVMYNCSHCGASIITNRSTAATVCVYCGKAVIMGEQIVDDFAPKYIIPFKISKDDCLKAFEAFAKKPLTPKDFRVDKVVDNMQGVYVPFWLFTCSCTTSLDCVGIKDRHWEDKKYEYIEQNYYNVHRKGTIHFENVPVDASSSIDNTHMDSIEPFDYKELVPFSPAYLSGFFAERYDEDKKTCFERAKHRIIDTTEQEIYNTCFYDHLERTKYNSNPSMNEANYVMIPTWFLCTTYKNKDYYYVMNGQTGKFIGNLPIDKTKLIIFTLIGYILGGSLFELLFQLMIHDFL